MNQKPTMKPKHTTGPWVALGYDIHQKTSGTRHVPQVAYTGPHHTPPHEYPISCKLVDEANARLIAAAPEMLEQLKYVVEVFGHDAECQCESCRYLKPVIDIIKKAEGEL
jgi:hypothetical protein